MQTQDYIIGFYILGALFVVFLPTLVAMVKGGNWFVILIANLVVPLNPGTYLALLFLAMRRRH